MVATAAPGYAPSSGSILDGIPTWAKWGGGLVGLVLVYGIAKKALK
jgi:hypothetical protein